MKKALIFFTVVIALSFLLLRKSYKSYIRIQDLSDYYTVNYHAIDKYLNRYYRDNLTFPESTQEIFESIESYENDFLIRLFSESEIRMINDGNQILIYDLGFDNIDDSLKSECECADPIIWDAVVPKQGDYLLYSKVIQNAEELLRYDFFIYDSEGRIIPDQSKFRESINEARKKFIREYYLNRFGLNIDKRIRKSGEEWDVVLIHGVYNKQRALWEISSDDIDLETDILHFYFNEIREEFTEAAEFYLTVYLVFDESKLEYFDHTKIHPNVSNVTD